MLYGNSDFSHAGPGKFPFQAKIPTKIPSLLKKYPFTKILSEHDIFYEKSKIIFK